MVIVVCSWTEDNIDCLEGEAGTTWLVHNWTIHRSGTNKSDKPRWAFSANYIDGRTKMLNPKPKDASPLADIDCKFGEIFVSPFEQQWFKFNGQWVNDCLYVRI